jgi:uroporphyrinogen-III synthase
MQNTLSGLNVIITRPVLQSRGLAQAIIDKHGNPILLPTLEIVGIEHHIDLAEALNHLRHYDLLIFTSQNAVLHVAPSLRNLEMKTAKIAAIGPSTANLLLQYRLPVDILPSEQFNTEGLMTLLNKKKLAGKNILIFSGEGGACFLEQELKNKQAHVTKIAVYRRLSRHFTSQQVTTITCFKKNCIIITTSCESLESLAKNLSFHAKRKWLFDTPLLIISPRMKQCALTLGFDKELLLLAKNALDQSILECLIKWYSNRPKDPL